jgi:signal transduction histidine kinase
MTQEADYQNRLRKLAHELRTPLSVICMGLQVLESVRNDDEQFKTIHQFMNSAGKELTHLIDSMVAEFEPKPIDAQQDGK